MRSAIRLLLLADSHLGFDLPDRPRVSQRRRGHDFLSNYAAALEPALRGEVDVVVHGGDVFDRARVSSSLAYQALAPLVRVAERGVPVFVVPGNHERSSLPHQRFASHPAVYVFDRPLTVVVEIAGIALSVSGFPFERGNVRTRFRELLEASEWRTSRASLRLLCMHQCVEGATVGPGNFTFTTSADVIRARDIPAGFAAVLSGHIHRHQVLTADLQQRPLAAPVMYPGSLERTSFAEIGEEKGFMIVHLAAGDAIGAVRWEFRRVGARPMVVHELRVEGLSARALDAAIRRMVAAAPPDAVLRIRLVGDLGSVDWRAVSAARVRAFAPASMNIEITGDRWFPTRRSRPQRDVSPRRAPAVPLSLDLG